MRDLPSPIEQGKAIALWLQGFASDKRRPSEAAMEVAAMSDAKRRKMFRNLRSLKCIEHTDRGWIAVRGLPTTEQIAMDDEIGKD